MDSPEAELANHLREQIRAMDTAEELGDLSRRLPDLVESVRETDLRPAVAAVSGLMTLPQLQPNSLRLEALAHLLVAHAMGGRVASSTDLHNWLNIQLGDDFIKQMEDPVEDVFVGNVVTGGGNRRIFNGVWETPDLWLQPLLDVLATAPATPEFQRVRAEVDSLLCLADAVAQRASLSRFLSSDGQPQSLIGSELIEEAWTLSERVAFTPGDLNQLGVHRDALLPFMFDLGYRSQLLQQTISGSDLELHPLMPFGDELILALPAAVSSCLRIHILRRIKSIRGALVPFSEYLRRRQSHLLFIEGIGPRSVDDVSSRLPRSTIDPKRLSGAAVEFDEGMFAHIVLLHDDCEEVLEEGLTSFRKLPEVFNRKFTDYLEACAQRFRESPNFLSGFTLVVIGGVGRGLGMIPPSFPSDWRFTVWSLPDAHALAWHDDEWLLTLWKFLSQRKALEDSGCGFLGHSDATLLSYWRDNGYRLLPRQYPYGTARGEIGVSPGYIASFRRVARRSFDAHAVLHPRENAWINVRKTVPKGFFKEVERLPTYASPDDAMQGRLRGVVETNSRAWWLECLTGASEEIEKRLHWLLWDAGLNWLVRLAPEIEKRIENLPARNIVITIDLTDRGLSQALKSGPPSGGEVLQVSVEEEPPTVRIKALGPLVGLLAQPENLGDRALVNAIVSGAQSVSRDCTAAIVQQIVSAVVPSVDARFIHLFPRPDSIRDVLAQFDRPNARPIQEVDERFASLGLAWRVVDPEEDGVTIHRQHRSNDFLHSVVDALWDRIRLRLEKLDRQSLITQCLRNHEGLLLDRFHWRRTSRALAAVYRDRDDVVRAAREQEVAIARTSLACRVLVEMAMCTSPTSGGRDVSWAEMDQVLADVSWIIRTAYDSDAINSALSDPSIGIFPNGEFAVSEEFYETVLAPYQNGHFAEQFQENVKAYDAFYKEDERRKGLPVEEVFEPEFVAAFQDEYGLPLQLLPRVNEALDAYALDLRSIVVSVRIDEMRHLLAERSGCSSAQFEAFLRNFCLAPRDRWDAATPGFRNEDWFPWRFRRRLSLMSRPVLRINDTADSMLVYAPGLVHDSFANLVGETHSGHFDTESFSSAAMIRWTGTIADRKGHDFNKRVAEKFRELEFEARPSVKMSELNSPVQYGDLGDVDVLAWSNDGAIYPVECKNLRFARTMGEIVDQLKRFRGEANDELNKHVRRCEWLAQNPHELSKFTGIAAARIKIKPLMVTNTIVPMQFSRALPIPANDIVPISALPTRLQISKE